MTKIHFTIIVPDFFAQFISQKTQRPVAGETWHFGTRNCEIRQVGPELTIVRISTKPRIKIKTKDLIRYGHRVSTL